MVAIEDLQAREVDIPKLDSGAHRFQRAFDAFSSATARWTGHSIAFAVSVGATLLWAISGPLFDYSDTWQLIINTGTTVLTFLMVFILQNTLNRDSKALHIKLDELLRVTEAARDSLMGIEQESEEHLDGIKEQVS